MIDWREPSMLGREEAHEREWKRLMSAQASKREQMRTSSAHKRLTVCGTGS